MVEVVQVQEGVFQRPNVVIQDPKSSQSVLLASQAIDLQLFKRPKCPNVNIKIYSIEHILRWRPLLINFSL